MLKALTIDAETKDPYISAGAGAGWCYAHTLEDSLFKVLGFAIRTHDGQEFYESDFNKVAELVDSHDILIMHNATYDVGCLSAVGIDTRYKRILDTKIMSALFYSARMSHSLAELSKDYLKGVNKLDHVLIESVDRHGLYEGRLKNPKEKDLLKYAKANMDQIQNVDYEAIATYAVGDISATYLLAKYFKSNGLNMALAYKWSGLVHMLNDMRVRGVRIDMHRLEEVHSQLVPLIASKYEQVYAVADKEFNINSPKQVAETFDELRISYPTNPKTGNPSITTPWMAQQKHPLCKAISEARKAVKIDRDFIIKIRDMQEYTCPAAYNGESRYGRVHPELNLLAARTGRFSCTNPNVQQIPADKEYGDLVRSIFVPEEGDKWFSLDFSNQEGRLQVHYAYNIKAEGSDLLVEEFKANPNLDLHQKVADLAGITRKQAKAVNLGISYGMGIGKLAEQLGITKAQASHLRGQYNDIVPFLDQLNKKCMSIMERQGRIETLGGRESHIDPPAWVDGEKQTFEYKALNKLIQASAADQTIECMINAYEAGIKMLFPVHDSIEISGTKEEAILLKQIMETAVPLNVPVVADGNLEGGYNWAEAK